MSSKPYPAGVAKAIEALARLEVLNTAIVDLQPKAAKVAADLKAAVDERGRLEREVPELLESMDLASTGNYGFGCRLGWFLAEMRRQIIADVKAKMDAPTDGAKP